MGLDYLQHGDGRDPGLIRCGGVPMAIGVQTDMCTPALARFGSDEPPAQREFLARPLPATWWLHRRQRGGRRQRRGRHQERGAQDGDDYVITGQKMWITNSLQADWMCMLVNTSDGPQHKNKSLVMVPMRDGPNGKLTKGIEVARKIRKIGMNSSDTGLIYFDEVRVPQRNRSAPKGRVHLPDAAVPGRAPVGWRQRLLALTNCIRGPSRARQRQMFGATLLDQQWVQFKTGRAQTEVEALRALTYRAGERYAGRGRAATGPAWPSSRPGRLNRGGRHLPAVLGGMGFTLGEQRHRACTATGAWPPSAVAPTR